MKIYRQKAQEPKYQLGQVVFYLEEGDNDIRFSPFVVRTIFINFGGSVSYGLMPVTIKDGKPVIDTFRNNRERIQERYLMSDKTEVVSYTQKVAKRLRERLMKRVLKIREEAATLASFTNFEVEENEEE